MTKLASHAFASLAALVLAMALIGSIIAAPSLPASAAATAALA